MYYQPRNPEADAKFIEAGGLKSWGCFALIPVLLALVLFFVILHALLTNLMGEQGLGGSVCSCSLQLWQERFSSGYAEDRDSESHKNKPGSKRCARKGLRER